jgi:hypothetical protein
MTTFGKLVRQTVLLAFAGLLALGGCAGTPEDAGDGPEDIGQTQQAFLFSWSGWDEIGFWNGGCLDQFEWGTSPNNTRAVTWPCNGYQNQGWFFDSSGRIRAGVGVNLCVYSHTTTENRLGYCDDPNLFSSGRNRFAVVTDGNGYKSLKLLYNNTCLAVDVNGNQQWVFPYNPANCAAADGVIPAQSRIYTNSAESGGNGVLKTMRNRCMDVQNNNSADGTPVWMWDCSPIILMALKCGALGRTNRFET